MLIVRDLVKIYPGPVAALQGVDLDLPVGMFGLLGPNGAGKTTLMRILAGLLEPTSGTAELDGESIVERPERIRSRLGYLPQDFGFFPHLSGAAMLRYLLRLKGVRAPGGLNAICDELLDRVHLSYAAGRKVKTYSGGMRQRLGIAQAIAGDPRLIIVDEPTAGLDPEERQRFYRLLSELAERRIVVLSTHIVEDVAQLCPRFAIMRGGRLVARTNPEHALRTLEGTIFEATVTAAEYQELAADPGCCIAQAYLVGGSNRVRVYQPKGHPPRGFLPSHPTLDDFYHVVIKTAGLGAGAADQSNEASAELRVGTGATPLEAQETVDIDGEQS
jgi:ABC-type multidrug transport system ATPase subunit